MHSGLNLVGLGLHSPNRIEVYFSLMLLIYYNKYMKITVDQKIFNYKL
jgi:hypothetical protein